MKKSFLLWLLVLSSCTGLPTQPEIDLCIRRCHAAEMDFVGAAQVNWWTGSPAGASGLECRCFIPTVSPETGS